MGRSRKTEEYAVWVVPSTRSQSSWASGQDSLLRAREIPGNLAHPPSVRRWCDACDLHLPRRQVDEEQNDKTLQSSPRPHFHGEEICSYNQLPMPAQKLLPCRLSPPLGCGLYPVSFQNRSDRTASKFVAQIGQCTLDSSIPPIPVFFCHANHQSLDLAGDARSARRAMCSSAVLLDDQFPMQANKVSGVTRVATSARTLRPNVLALTANRRRWSSLKRTRRPPSCSRRTRFSSRR